MLARVPPKAVEEVEAEVEGEGEEEVGEGVVEEDQEQEQEVGMEEGAAVVEAQPPLGVQVQQLLLRQEERQEERGRRRQQQGLEEGSSGLRQSGEEAALSFPPLVKLLLFLRS